MFRDLRIITGTKSMVSLLGVNMLKLISYSDIYIYFYLQRETYSCGKQRTLLCNKLM